MIYMWGYNGHRKLDEDSVERYFSVPQKFTNSASAELEKKLPNSVDDIIQFTDLSFSPNLAILSTLKGHKYQHSERKHVKHICQQDDTTYLIYHNGLCQVVSYEHNKLEQCIVKKDQGVESVRLNQVAAGDLNTIALTENNKAGRISRDSKSVDYIFRPFTPPISCKQISCGKEHVLLLTLEGKVYSFSMGSRGQLGHGVTDTQTKPKLIEALATVSMATISCGGWHSAAVSDIQDLYIWGWNESGQLGFKMKQSNDKGQSAKSTGHSSTSSKTHSPPLDLHREDWKSIDDDERVLFHLVPAILDLPGNHNVSKVSCGSRHTAAVTDNGTLFTWGWGEYGQLGHGDRNTRDTPTQVQYFTDNRLTVTDIDCQDWNTVCFCSENG